ncbi:hypothetical protein PCANC_06160 [Puccinia coronata f. sp. avenae]|uniref:Reverse transcriptase Ty1/copia-type domain-containing protein n=1 Tax=Puccinia coronata f. sp. avenae TaxID=200324 RepID=A0A2N5VTM0_9BASI|nr:hypothetical protein PCANC_06160 [Puccinia coronata f. sp. avenae]
MACPGLSHLDGQAFRGVYHLDDGRSIKAVHTSMDQPSLRCVQHLDGQAIEVHTDPKIGGYALVLELKKAIYGLKQSSLAWYNRLSTFLTSIGFSVSVADPCVFWRTNAQPTWIFAHVDDLIIFSKNPSVFRAEMENEFKIKYLGEASFLLGMKLDRVNGSLVLHQSQYIERKLAEFDISHLHHSTVPLNPKSHLQTATNQEIAQLSNISVSYRALIGSLNYLSVLTRPDISYAVSKLSQFLDRPGIRHYTAAIQVFRYLKGTMHQGLLFKNKGCSPLNIHVDADWGNCPDTQRLHTGYLSMVNSHIVSWKSTKQSTVSHSTTEAEYKALTDAGKEACWIINLTKEIRIHTKGINPPTICIDNRGALDLARSEISQNGFRTKHMDLWLHFVRKLLRQNIVQTKYVTSQSNQADFLTKPVGRLIIR